MNVRIALFVFCVLIAACGDDPPPRSPAAPPPKTEAKAPAVCPEKPTEQDAAALLARHAKAYGAPEAVDAQLPLSFVEKEQEGETTGTRETSLTKDAFRMTADVGALHFAYGMRGGQAWTMSWGTGVVEPLRKDEAMDSAFASWLLRRRYLLPGAIVDPEIFCGPGNLSGMRLDITFGDADVGHVQLQFDLESSALVGAYHMQADGEVAVTSFESWTEPEHGVRWPQKSILRSSAGSTPLDLVSRKAGLSCAQGQGDVCLAPPPERLAAHWPEADALGRVMTRVPFTYLGGGIFVRVKVDGREMTALLDSGAGTTAIDAGSRLAESFHVVNEVGGSGSTQAIRVGTGELGKIELGGLTLEHVPAASVPLPVLDIFGSRRPELIIGFVFFAEHVVRIDYANQQLVIAKKKEGILAKGKDTHELPFRLLEDKLVALGSLEGTEIPLAIDTGSGDGIDVYGQWAVFNDFPGERPITKMKGHFGAGADLTEEIYVRIAKASLGPIAYDDHLAGISNVPDSGRIGGLVGNLTLARCDAAILDLPARMITFEGTCNRPVPQRRAGWRIGSNRIVEALFPGGAAEAAGVQVGDQLVEIGGKPASDDPGVRWSLEEQPAGTKLPVTFMRGKTPVKLVIVLRDLAR